jgi:hypothetical protein
VNLVRKILATGLAAATFVPQLLAAPLSGDARAAIPNDVQQLIVIDYRAMQNSQVAMQLKDRVMPPELKQLEQALRKSGLNDNHDVDVLAFASFRTKAGGESTRMVGIAQGQFQMREFLLALKKKGIKPELVRTNKTYPMGDTGMRISFLNSSAFVFGSGDAVKLALDARDGIIQNMLSNQTVTDLIGPVGNDAFWSVLDAKGTQFMLRSMLSEAPQVSDYEVVKKTLEGSRYSMNFANGVEFNLDVITPDRLSATALSTVLNAALLYKKVSGNDTEKAAMAATTISSDGGTLKLRYESSDNQFASLLNSQLFQSVVR